MKQIYAQIILGITLAVFPSSVLSQTNVPDLAIAYGASASGAIKFESSGLYSTVAEFPADGGPKHIASGDIDGDGWTDLAVAYESSGVVLLLRRVPGSSSYQQLGLLTAILGAQQVLLADVDANGTLDVVVACSGPPISINGRLFIFLNNGVGEFNRNYEINSPPDVPNSIGTLTSYFSVAAADFNNDGRVDLVTGRVNSYFLSGYTGAIYSGDVTIFLNAGGVGQSWAGFGLGGSIDVPNQLSAGAPIPVDLDTGDLDNDGIADVAMVSGTQKTISVLYTNGAGSFRRGDSFHLSVSGDATAVSVGQFRGDLLPDFLVTVDMESGADGLLLFTSIDGGADFALREIEAANEFGPSSISSYDINSDGFLDAVISFKDSGAVRWYMGGENMGGEFFRLETSGAPVFALPGRWSAESGTSQPPGDDDDDDDSVVFGDTSSYALWNGFLGMTNILEMVNNSSNKQALTIDVQTIDGALASSTEIILDPNTQRDIVVNDLAGFTANSYGIVKITGNSGGRLFYYRPVDASFSAFEFAFGIPLSSPTSGKSSVGFNTFQPSANPGDANNLVANWLSVVNLATTTQQFRINKYSQNGELLTTEDVSISSLGRRDLDGGHVIPGPTNVGLLEIIPLDDGIPYLAQLMRYGSSSSGGYDFAFPLLPTAGDNQTITVPISSKFNAQTWLEVISASANSETMNVKFFSSGGALLSDQTLDLAPHSQRHLNATEILGAEAIGHAEITGSGVISQSMHYFRDSFGGVLAMYGSQARAITEDEITGSYNLFLGMENYLNLVNTSSDTVSFSLVVSSSFSQGSSSSLELPPKAAMTLELHNEAKFGTARDTYGTVSVNPESAGRVMAEVLRLKMSDNKIEFVAPTSVN